MRESGGVVKRDIDPYIIRVGIKRRKRGCEKFREEQALPDENDDTAASVCGIRRENTRPEVGAIRKLSRESRNSERRRGVMIGFLDTDKADRMGREEVELFSTPGSKTSSIPLKNPVRVRGERMQEA